MGGFMNPQMQQGQYGWWPEVQNQLSQWLTQIQGAEMPGTPEGLKGGIEQMQKGAATNYPIIEQMLQGMVRTGGIGPIQDLFGRMQDLRGRQTAQGLNELMARSSVTPTSMRAMAGGLADQRSQQGLQDLLTLTGLQESAYGRQMGAGQQLAGLPSQMWGAPTSLEMALHQMNVGWEQNRLNQLGNYYNMLPQAYGAGNYAYMNPSLFQQYITPWLGAGMQGMGQALPYLFML